MKRVFIGVGHGGSDGGAAGNGLLEKDVNLSIALHLREALQRCGIKVGISRTVDEDDPTTEEVRECNAFAPDCAVDIHTNAGGGTGFEVFCSITGGTSRVLAQNVSNAMEAAGYKSRGVKTKVNSTGRDYFGFIRQTDCPAVILECAFIDSSDYKLIETEFNRKRIAEVYAKGICKTLGVTYKEADVGKMTVDEAKQIIREKAGLDETTIQFLSFYKYADSLILKLAQAMD